MNHDHLNLARKWRSQRFEELVGQELAVKIIKNSLYRNFLFPVYLLSGTRGCGKTSMARIFAAALNCSQLSNFQKDPQKITVPCLSCDSCQAMKRGKHPDFIEIDAASHTGVDNVRSIIDASSFVPALGTKKIYLIDEAHMLSKAAFNALLKVLEEPPPSALFILATTDYHKILPTVKSRCFQIFFQPISHDILVSHLENICFKEELSFTKQALDLIVSHAQGSARDALNILERVRLFSAAITEKSVCAALNVVDNHNIYKLFSAVLSGSAADIIESYKAIPTDMYVLQEVWKKGLELLRMLLWAHNDIILSDYIADYEVYTVDDIKKLKSFCTLEQVIEMIELCYSYELIFSKTAAPSVLFETMLMALHAKASKKIGSMPSSNNEKLDIKKKYSASSNHLKNNNSSNVGLLNDNILKNEMPIAQDNLHAKTHSIDITDSSSTENSNNSSNVNITSPLCSLKELNQATSGIDLSSNHIEKSSDKTWLFFIKNIHKYSDHLLISLFEQAFFVSFSNGTVVIRLPYNLRFFKDWIDGACSLWQPELNAAFGSDLSGQESNIILQVDFELDQALNFQAQESSSLLSGQKIEKKEYKSKDGLVSSSMSDLSIVSGVSQKKVTEKKSALSVGSQKIYKNSNLGSDKVVDKNLLDALPKAQLLMRYFPGKVVYNRY